MIKMMGVLKKKFDLKPGLDVIGYSSKKERERLRSIATAEDVLFQLRFIGELKQTELASRLTRYRILLNFAAGALDKSALEGMASGLLILTTNPCTIECLPRDLRPRLSAPSSQPVAQAEKLEVLLKLDSDQAGRIQSRLERIVHRDHSLETFWERVFSVLDSLEDEAPPRNDVRKSSARG